MKRIVRVVGGEKTQINEYPWIALLRHWQHDSSGSFCGGTLIKSRWILTATHCIFEYARIDEGRGQGAASCYVVNNNDELILL